MSILFLGAKRIFTLSLQIGSAPNGEKSLFRTQGSASFIWTNEYYSLLMYVN